MEALDGASGTQGDAGAGGVPGGRPAGIGLGARPGPGPLRGAGPFAVFGVLLQHRSLIFGLARRDVLSRYRGSAFGLLWSFFHPLLMLGVYTFVFGGIFRARWGEAVEDDSGFALVLFAGLIVFWLLSECLGRAPGLVRSHPPFVKRIVFPLEILSWVTVLSALFHFAVSLGVLLLAAGVVLGPPPPSALALPLILLPIALVGLAAGWLLSALGVYVRDLDQAMPVLTTALLFLTPIFYPPSALPAWARGLAAWNPLALSVEQARDALLWGRWPDWAPLAAAAGAAWALSWLALACFVRARRGFADVV